MAENLVSQIFASNGRSLRFYEKIVRNGEKKTKYEVDFLMRQNGKATPIEAKSGNSIEHSSPDYFDSAFEDKTSKPIILTKGDLKETEDCSYLPLAMACFLQRDSLFSERRISSEGTPQRQIREFLGMFAETLLPSSKGQS